MATKFSDTLNHMTTFTSTTSHAPIPSIFVHFFNDQILSVYKILERHSLEAVTHNLVESIVYAYLLTDFNLIIPTVDLIQSMPLRHVLQKIDPILQPTKSGKILFTHKKHEIA